LGRITDIQGFLRDTIGLFEVVNADGQQILTYSLSKNDLSNIILTAQDIIGAPKQGSAEFLATIQGKISWTLDDKHLLCMIDNNLASHQSLGSYNGWLLDLVSGVLYDTLAIPRTALTRSALHQLLENMQLLVIQKEGKPALVYQPITNVTTVPIIPMVTSFLQP
jgi:hypothetical protein